MTPEQAIDKLRRMQKWGKMTDVKREALDMGIKAIESHDVAKEVDYKSVMVLNGEMIAEIYCPYCNRRFGFNNTVPVPKFCDGCGQKLGDGGIKEHEQDQNKQRTK